MARNHIGLTKDGRSAPWQLPNNGGSLAQMKFCPAHSMSEALLLLGGISLVALGGCGGGGSDGPSAGGASQLANANQPFVDDLRLTTTEGTAVSGTVTGFDVEGSPLFFSLTIEPTHGTVNGLPPGPQPGQVGSPSGFFTYVPDPGFVGFDSFKFTANDGDLNSRKGNVAIEVRPAGFADATFAADTQTGSAAAEVARLEPAGSIDSGFTAIRHALPDGHHAIYVFDPTGRESPVKIADSRQLGAVGDAFTATGGRVFFRADGKLMRWHAGQAAPTHVSLGTAGPTTLGELARSSNGSWLAVVSGSRGSGRQSLFLVDTSGALVPEEVTQPSLRSRWIHNLRFAEDGLELRFDVVTSPVATGCTLSVRLDSDGAGVPTVAEPDGRCQAR